MNRITIETDRESYAPGETVAIRIILELDKPVEARRLVAGLYRKRHVVKRFYSVLTPEEIRRMRELGLEPTTTVKERESQYEEEKCVGEKELAEEGVFESGEYGTAFDLPSTAEPTSYVLGHDNQTDVWMIRVKLDVPLALDASGEKEIFVRGL